MYKQMEVVLRIIIQEDVLIKNLILSSLNGMVGETYSFCYKIIFTDLLPRNRVNDSHVKKKDCHDTCRICTDGNPFARLVKLFVIEPYFTSKRGTCWRSYLSKSSTGVMTIFLFDKAVVDTVPWDKIREDYLVAKRYEYTLEQLDSLNWTIVYPPEE